MVYRDSLYRPPSQETQEAALLHRLVAETLFWANPQNPRSLTGDNAIYRALENAHITSLPERKLWIARIKTILKQKRTEEVEQAREEQEAREEIARATLKEDAFRHEAELALEEDLEEAA